MLATAKINDDAVEQTDSWDEFLDLSYEALGLRLYGSTQTK